ncbi:MAG: protein-export membrane protein SecD [Candidatus Wildermuthbacteria bacterium RIFCSPHIGHO2_02_FULL_47_12]|uniref:Protein translocase subunit SecD n=1 Tax=Candidatus Wildermuthbacteria bacterium RIFCSPHIGHO2_02_FULL_47_12 TaxID=1802451 RepID=A0A1G2R2P3_9BACT|nr:MAG: protein-export membrane protein SecD [Candidatus Wildermuthbacteria bacterium RIFCSPHIGHO2_02_FULL_47_12]
MRKKRVYLIILALVVLGVGSALFVYPQYINGLLGKAGFLPSFIRIPEIPFQLGLDLQGGMHLVYQADLSQIQSGEYDSAMAGLRDVIERRVNLFGVKEPLVQVEGSDKEQRLIVELAGVLDFQEATRLIGQTPYLEFAEQKENYEEVIANNQKVVEAQEGNIENPFASTPLTGRYLDKAELSFDSITQESQVQLQFNEEGAKLFEELTKKNVGRPLAIFLDGQLLSAPTVQEPIAGGKAQITGQFSIEEARQIVRDLNAGALPVPITLLSQQNVGASLGHDSLVKSLNAGMIGLLAIVLFMILVYRVPGLFACLALLLYLALLLALFKIIPVTLTLAGIAGVILSVGMAVDANVLIFSRMREEVKEGKGYLVAMEEGFARAWPSIRDGNLTTLFVALILFWFGSSFVQGFALTLSLGIVLSMFSAIVATRNFMRIFAGTFFEKLTWLWK